MTLSRRRIAPGMMRISTWLALILIPAPILPAEPLRVTLTVAPRPYFVGQGIELGVDAGPGEPSPSVEAPKLAGAELIALPADPVRPGSSRFVVVPLRAGPLDLPAFRVRSGDRSGASKPTRLAVSNVPAEGRPPAFLGGVGAFEVRSEAEPADVRVGQTFEFRVQVSGPAAWGSLRTPDLGGWIASALEVEAIGDRLQSSRPARTFRYRARALKPGRVALPPIAVAAFDPSTRRYATRATTGLAVWVEEPPRFDPRRIDDGPASTTSRGPGPVAVAVMVGVPAIVSVSALAAWRIGRRRRRARRLDAGRLARELARGLDAEGAYARAVVEALTTFLHRAGGRAPGVLTPPEARDGFDRLTADPTLGARAEALVASCDRSNYGPGAGERVGLIVEAKGFFEGVAGAMGRGKANRGG